MADHAGSPFQRIFHAPGNPQLPVLPSPSDPKEGLIQDRLFSGAAVTFGADKPNLLPVAGASPGVARGFSQTFLNQIGATPNPIDFGNITADKQAVVTVHNTYRTPVDVTAIDLAGISGVSLLSPALPVTIPPFSSQVFTFEASITGDPDFDAEAAFTASEGSFSIRFIGRRVIIFDVNPQKQITERIQFLTDSMIAHDGTEQVMALRTAPRSRLTAVVRLNNDSERGRLTNLLLGAQHLLQGVQLWYQSREITAAALATDSVIQVGTGEMEISVGTDMSFALPDGSSVEGEVQAFDATSITLTQEIGVALPLRTNVMPLRFGYAANTANVADFAVNIQDIQFTVDLIDYENIGNVDPAYFESHPVDGLPILIAPLFFDARARASRIVSNTDKLDSQVGDIASFRSELLSRPQYPVLVDIRSYADQHAWRRFLHDRLGSWGAFYVPTGTNDLPISGVLSLGSNTFDVPNIGVASLLNNVAPRRDVRVTANGTHYYRRITAVSDNGATEEITLNASIPGVGSLQPSEVVVSWLTLSRIVGDVATFRHLYRGVAELRFNIRGVIA